MKLEEAIKIMRNWIEYEKTNRNKINKADELIQIQETILQALDNSIPKEKAKKKIEVLKAVKERNIKRNFDTVYKDGYYTGGIDAIYELLEENI